MPMPVENLLSRLVGHPVTIVQGEATSLAALHLELGRVLATLSERDADVLSGRLGLDDGRERTFDEIGVSIHISSERVRQIEEKALGMLRHPSRVERLKALVESSAEPADGFAPSDADTAPSGSKSHSYLDKARESHIHGHANRGRQMKIVNSIACTRQGTPSER